MNQIRDALELLTAQHQELDELCDRVARSRDAGAFDELADKLTTHLAAEQELLYPLVARHVTNEVMSELLTEHIAIKRLLSELVWLGVHDDEFAELFTQMGDLLIGHAAWQEDELFTCAAEKIPSDRLADLGDAVAAF